MLAAEELVMIEVMEVRKTENVMFIPMDRGEVQRPAYIVILQDIVSLPAEKNLLKDLQMIKRRFNSRRRPT